MTRWVAVIETQSYGHYTEFARCEHRHITEDAALECAARWEHREATIRDEEGLLDNGARFVVRMESEEE